MEASAQILQTWESAHKPGRILYPFNSFPHGDPQTLAEVDKFLEKLESFISIRREVIDLEQSWQEGMPSYAGRIFSECEY